jgi:hypothetical protein
MTVEIQQNNIRLGESDLSSFDDIQDMQYQRSNEALYLADRQRILSRVIRMFGLGIFLVLGTTGYHLAIQGGPKPPVGDKGPVGNKGLIGDKGEQGERGEKGPSGGPQGDAGEKGLMGEKGAKGDSGEQGEKGDTGKGWIGGRYNADTGVATFDSDDGLEFNTKDLRGADGKDSVVPGPKGEQGSKGSKGEQGDSGDRGEKGMDSAIPGPKGDEGPKGSKGEQGNSGDRGEKGMDSTVPGSKGDIGPIGSKGDTGEKGPKGTKGDIGSTSKEWMSDCKGVKVVNGTPYGTECRNWNDGTTEATDLDVQKGEITSLKNSILRIYDDINKIDGDYNNKIEELKKRIFP